MGEPQATAVAERPKLTFIQKCKTRRGQQIICTTGSGCSVPCSRQSPSRG